MSELSGLSNRQGDKTVHRSARDSNKAGRGRLLDGKGIVKAADGWQALHNTSFQAVSFKAIRERLNEDEDINAVDNNGRTALHEAAREGVKDVIWKLLNRGVDITAVDNDGRTALHEAAREGSEDVIWELLKRGVDITAVDNNGRTALHEAAQVGSSSGIEVLLSRGVDIRAVDKNGRTALHEAARAGSKNSIRELLNKGVNINAVDNNGRTALHDAAQVGSKNAIRQLLYQKADVRAVDNNGRTALHEAVQVGSSSGIEVLLCCDADIKAVDKNGRTALHEAAQVGSAYAISQLLNRGIDINVVDNNGRTALHVAARAGSDDVIWELLYQKADIRAVENNGRTALHEAAQVGSSSGIEVLLCWDADIKAVDKNGRTALHEAARAGSDDAIWGLLYQKADIWAVDNNGRTALHEAAQVSSSSGIEVLLCWGADIKAVDKNGRTALHEAVQVGSSSVIRKFLDKNADMNVVDNNGLTALHEAIRAGSDEVIEIMLPVSIQYRWEFNGNEAEVYEECNGAICDILTISKINTEGHCYIARSVSEFLQEFYPAFGEHISDWITKVYKKLGDHAGVRNPEEQLVDDICVTLSGHLEGALVKASLEPQQLMLTMSSTSKEFALEVKSALAWTFGSLQSRRDREGLFSVTLDQSSSDACLPSMTKFSLTKTENYCWTNLFRYACVTLPSSNSIYHPAKEGLEIDFDLLVKLAAVDREIEIDVGIILLGFDTALIPLDPPESKCWHFLTTDGKQITPNRIRKDLDRLKLRAQNNMSNQYNTGKVYVGWCDNPLVKIGTTESEPGLVEEALMTSGVPDVKKLEEMSEKTSVMGLSLVSSVGFWGSAFGLSGETKKEKMFRQVTVVAKRTPTDNFERVLDSACTSPYILWDNYTQRAWLLPAVSVLLFASLRYVIWKRYTFKRKGEGGPFKPSAFCYAEPSTDAKRAAVSCLRQNRTLLVEAADGHIMDGMDKDNFFEDIVRNIWLGMSTGEDICSSEITGRKYEPVDSLLGYDLQEAICGARIYLRKLRIQDFMKSWKPLAQAKQVQVVFCHNVGPVITCKSQGCSHACWDQQETQGVLSCLLQDLKYFYGECWNNPLKLACLSPNPPRLPVGDNFEWVPRGNEIFNHLDEDCSNEGDPCACCRKLERLQSITEIKRKHPKQKFKKSPSDSLEQSGTNPFSLPTSPSSLRFGSECN